METIAALKILEFKLILHYAFGSYCARCSMFYSFYNQVINTMWHNEFSLIYIEISISDPLFTGEESHMILYGGDMRYDFDIIIEFKPNSLYGLLFYTSQRSRHSSGDFLSVSLYAGRVQVRISFGGDNFVILTSDYPLFTGIRK